MRFWDSSAIVPLLVEQQATPASRDALAEDASMIVWWGSAVECAAALARLEREGAASPVVVADAFGRLGALAETWAEVVPGERVRAIAVRILRTSDLRAADALQLAAAAVASEETAASMTIVTHDIRLAAAAMREGFVVAGQGSPSASVKKETSRSS